MAMIKNTSLVELRIHDNPISEECAQIIVKALQYNNTLQLLYLNYYYSQDVKERIESITEEINKKRESHRYQVKLEIKFT